MIWRTPQNEQQMPANYQLNLMFHTTFAQNTERLFYYFHNFFIFIFILFLFFMYFIFFFSFFSIFLLLFFRFPFQMIRLSRLLFIPIWRICRKLTLTSVDLIDSDSHPLHDGTWPKRPNSGSVQRVFFFF
jgi:hypothetical protein